MGGAEDNQAEKNLRSFMWVEGKMEWLQLGRELRETGSMRSFWKG